VRSCISAAGADAISLTRTSRRSAGSCSTCWTRTAARAQQDHDEWVAQTQAALGTRPRLFVDFLRQSPLANPEIDLIRPRDVGRDIDL
jgi:hypothetical protein